MRFLMCLAALPPMSKETLTRKEVKKEEEKNYGRFFSNRVSLLCIVLKLP